MERFAMRKSNAFTLIEIILVVVIIALLATLVLTRIAGRGKQARIAAAKAQTSIIKTALNSFELDCGRFPTSTEGLGALIQKPVDLGESANWQRYLDESRIPLDPWGHEYLYRCPGAVNTDSYDLYSMGPDGKEGTDDDIGNIGT